MTINLLPILGIAIAAFWIWIGIRIYNRRERWAIHTAIAAAVLMGPIGGCCVLFPMVSTPLEVGRRSQCKNNLKQIGLALHTYHDRYGCLPPAYIADNKGRPIHSWRVLILPFMEQERLYKQYRFDEPWDGPNNRKLAESIVGVYNCPSDSEGGQKNESTTTNYVAIVGPDTAWPAGATSKFADFGDGSSNTILVVEVSNSGIHWMEPRDLHIVQIAPTINAKSGQGSSSRHAGGAHALLADGTVRYFPEKLTAELLRAWLTIDAGDKATDF